MNITGLKQADVDAANLKAQGDSVLATRQAWYHTIGDPMYFGEQRGEKTVKASKKSWKQAVADMKAANPYPAGYVPPENSNG